MQAETVKSVGTAMDTLSQSVLGALVVVLLAVCAYLIKQLLKAKDEKNTVVSQMADRLISQADQTQALVREHNQYYETLARQTETNTLVVKHAAKTVEAHAFACPHVDQSKFITIRGQGGS